MSTKPEDYVLPSSDSESERLERQGRLYGGTSFIDPYLTDKPASILEVGCGTGFFSHHVAQQLPESRIVGVDLDEGRLDYAQTNYELPNLKFEAGDMLNLPFEDNQFDLVFCRFVLVHATDPTVALKEMARVLKPGGRVVAYDMIHDGIWFSPEKPAFSKVLKTLIDIMKQKGMELSQGLHLPGAMKRAGLVDVETQVIPHHFLGSDPLFEDYRLNWLETYQGIEEIVGEKLERSMVDQAIEELSHKQPDDFLLELTVLVTGTKGH